MEGSDVLLVPKKLQVSPWEVVVHTSYRFTERRDGVGWGKEGWKESRVVERLQWKQKGGGAWY